MQKVCEWSNIKLSAVATDITGVSARAMLEAILAGRTAPETLAELAKGRLRSKRSELNVPSTAFVRRPSSLCAGATSGTDRLLDEQIELFDTQIVLHMTQTMHPTTRKNLQRSLPPRWIRRCRTVFDSHTSSCLGRSSGVVGHDPGDSAGGRRNCCWLRLAQI